MNNLFSFVSGFIFSLGLVISGMTNPDKVIGFLDIFGQWDYALVFVMGGAVIFNVVTFKFIKKKNSPLFGEKFEWPTSKDIDKKLVIGSTIFGIGWGIAGICPGPAIVNIVKMDERLLVFLASMFIGMVLYKFTAKSLNKVL